MSSYGVTRPKSIKFENCWFEGNISDSFLFDLHLYQPWNRIDYCKYYHRCLSHKLTGENINWNDDKIATSWTTNHLIIKKTIVVKVVASGTGDVSKLEWRTYNDIFQGNLTLSLWFITKHSQPVQTNQFVNHYLFLRDITRTITTGDVKPQIL